MLVLLAATVIAVVLSAPAATAQTLPQTPPYLQPNVTNTPGAGIGGFDQQLFGTPDPIPGYGGTVTAPVNPAATDGQYASPTAAGSQYASLTVAATTPTAATSTIATPLPDTGGPSLTFPIILAASLALVGGLAAVRRLRG